MDRVDDFFVKCPKCKKATWSQIGVRAAIDEWDRGNLERDDVSEEEEELL